MVFKMISAFAAMAVVTQWYGATYFSMSRVPKTTPSSTVGVGVGTMRNLSINDRVSGSSCPRTLTCRLSQCDWTFYWEIYLVYTPIGVFSQEKRRPQIQSFSKFTTGFHGYLIFRHQDWAIWIKEVVNTFTCDLHTSIRFHTNALRVSNKAFTTVYSYHPLGEINKRVVLNAFTINL
jgi:hypothetical protein